MAGQVVFGDDYFPRPNDEERVWRCLMKGEHMLLVAPRRVGKTSLLRHLESNPKPGYVFLYVMVQSCNNEHQFYKEILEKLISSEFTNRLEKLNYKGQELISNFFRKIKGIKIGDTGISFQDSNQKLTATHLEKIIITLNLDQKLILVFDEYPDVVEKISQYEGKQAAINFLTNTRSLCQNTELSQKVQFIFTGSIGLDTLAHRLNSTSLINDRDKVTIEPLTETNALKFIEFLAQKNDNQLLLNPSVAKYLLQKVEWLKFPKNL